ncbi:MAG: TonB-dependent receptor [Cyclobacteriaceae bacterium]|nr:TonB-dependent receptor [Cyclobacteriaceae bacterium]
MLMRKLLLIVSAFVLSASTLLAQGVTTSTLSGSLKDKNGAVPGANVVAVHEPTGTTYGTVSAADGKFTISNMRVGGPYKITISFVGYKTQTYSDISLQLGETYVLNHVLSEEGTQLEELVVTGEATKDLNTEKNGAVTNISSRQLLNMPTIGRSLNDMLRMTPQSSSTSTGSVGGGNFRQNNFTVDGSDFNNSFGIGGNLPGNNNPISLDAIEQVTVNVTPYDIRQSGFIGSSMNAVTRSGSNTLSGSVYGFFRNQDMQGNEVQRETPFVKQKLDIQTYGARLGGAIIKNKLFFFANYETSTSIQPGQQNFASTPEAPYTGTGNIARPTATDLNMISDYLKTNYNYDTGPYQGYDFKTTNTKVTARIDWNINEKHRFNVRYSQVENISPSFPSTSRTGAGPNYPQTRTSLFALPYKNANYYQENNLYSVAAELNSVFGTKFANTLRATYTDQNEPRSSDSKIFPFVDILDGSAPATVITGTTSTPLTSFGYEPFTYGNLRQVSTISVVDNLSWTSGKHGFTVGFQADMTSTKNGFQRNGTSYYSFNSWNDFITNQAPRDFAITYSLLPGYEQAFPTVKTSQYSIYGQDEYQVNDKLKLTAGLRLDMPFFNSTKEIQTHPLVASLTFSEGRKVDTGALPDSRVLFSPRIGFNYDVKGDRSLIVRGGTGVFTGKIPMVWIVAQSGDAGLIQFSQSYIGQAATQAAGIVFNPDPTAYRPATQPLPGTAIPANISALTTDFKFPQTWKSSLAIDIKLPLGINGSVEAIFNKDLNVAKGINPNLQNGVPINVTGYPDNRPFYPISVTDRYINPITAAGQPVASGSPTGTAAFTPVVLVNSQQGYYSSLTLKLEKPFSNGFTAMVAYTRSDAQVVFDGGGDQLGNTWTNTQIVGNPNFAEASYAAYIVPDRFIASISYRKEYIKHLATQISLFYEGSIQGRYSYTYSGDFNRDGVSGNDLIYIPKDPSEIAFVPTIAVPQGVWTAAEQSALFFKFIDQDPYLSKHKGEYAQRNGAELPWRSQVDVRIVQDIFANIGKTNNTLQFTLDIFNVGNLLNKEWGVFKDANAATLLVPVNASTLQPNGSVLPTFRLSQINGYPVGDGSSYALGSFRNRNTIGSTYFMQIGFRYTF